MRYNEYDAIINKISYCMRALETLTDHVISPDDISKTSLQYVQDEDAIKDDNTGIAITRLKAIEKKLKLENKIRKIVRTTLLKGDCFVELVVSQRGSNLLTVLNESYQPNGEMEQVAVPLKYVLEEKEYAENGAEIINSVTYNGRVIIEYNNPLSLGLDGRYFTPASANMSIPMKTYTDNPSTMISKDPHQPGNGAKLDDKKVDQDAFRSNFDKPNEEEKPKEVLLQNIYLIIHNPKYIVRLETERFRACLGYLVFPKIDAKSLMSKGGFTASTINSVDGVCNSILMKLSKKLIGKNDNIHISDDMKRVILSQLKAIENNADLRIRFVPEDKMIHWRLNPDKFDPYGESIFECVNFNCRLLMALETATTIKRLTHSTDKRVINVETGLPRDAQNIINSLKESLNKRKISINSMGSIDSIPSQIQTFETIFVPMRDNKKFVEFDKMEWGMNPQEDIEPLKFMRDSIVAALGVPAPYLGLEENTSNRSLLTVENINFTRTIIALQKSLTPYLVETLSKAYHILYHDPTDANVLDTITVSFQEPRTSPYEHQMEYIQQAQSAIEALKTLGIPQDYLKKKYLPHFDWEKIENESSSDNLNIELGETENPNDMMGGGMGMGMGGGMMGGGMM